MRIIIFWIYKLKNKNYYIWINKWKIEIIEDKRENKDYI